MSTSKSLTKIKAILRTSQTWKHEKVDISIRFCCTLAFSTHTYTLRMMNIVKPIVTITRIFKVNVFVKFCEV
jgi:hypothetical protein